jgi:dipeptidyl aminopeptidase/acylaminoacyl peptidase
VSPARRLFTFLFIVSLVPAVLSLGLAAAQCRSDQRRVTVADTIEMTEVAPSDETDAPGLFSPDGSRFAVVLTKGDLKKNSNVYTLLIFSTRTAFVAHKPVAIVKMSSNSNLPGIADLRWLKDGQTLLFLGETPNAPAQIYSFNLPTRTLRRLTHHPTSIVAYDASDDGRVVVFEAEPAPVDIVRTPETQRHGFVVAGEELSTLLFSGYRTSDSTVFQSRSLFLMTDAKQPQKIAFEDGVWPFMTLSVSPNGQYALIEAYARHIPADWKQYGSGVLHVYIAARKQPAALALVETYLLLDTKTGRLSSLLGTPKEWQHDGYLWLNGGQSLVVSRSYLPLKGITPDEQRSREQHPSVVEIELPSREMVPIDNEDLTASAWNQTRGDLVLSGHGDEAAVRKVYRRRNSSWVPVPPPSGAPKVIRPVLTIVQGMNTPPKLWLTEPTSGRKEMLLDPNPQFSELCFAQESKVEWKATDGHPMTGGLYMPPDYTAGHRYPLVIQTHAFDPDKFWIDGPWHSAYAAQALAARGIVVLQMGYDHVGHTTPEEAPRAMAAIEGAINALDQQGIIDPGRVGIIGFSRSVYHVAYTLTHSKYHFAAATLADGVDGDYFQSVAFGATAAPFGDAVNGGPPWGPTLARWMEHSPLFNVGSVRCPIRLEAYDMNSVLALWGWYALLSRRDMPVDMIVLPHAIHLLVKPWERLVSQQGNVDWFSFWLENKEDPSPGKVDQYARWRQLSALASKADAQEDAAPGH